MNNKLNPTMILRWIEEDEAVSDIPIVTSYGYVKSYFKLQQYWKSENGDTGEWRDISIDYNPEGENE